jgi:hypothetical protein
MTRFTLALLFARRGATVSWAASTSQRLVTKSAIYLERLPNTAVGKPSRDAYRRPNDEH